MPRERMDEALLNAATSSAAAPPRDSFWLAFLILYLQGVGSLFPWNAFITKTDYYALAFRDSDYASSFESMITTTFTLVGLVTILGLQRVQDRSSPRVRVVGALSLMLVVFLVIFAFAAAPLRVPPEELRSYLRTSATPLFAVTVVCVATAGFAQAVLSGSLFTYATLYGRPTYLQAISGGMGVAGLSVSLGSLVTTLPQTAKACGADGHAAHGPDDGDDAAVDAATVAGAAVYFGLACLVLAACLLAFLALERLPFTKACQQLEKERVAAEASPRETHTHADAEALALESVVAAPVEGGGGGGGGGGGAGAAAKKADAALLPRLWMWALALTLIYAVTLGLFPSLTSTIQSSGASCEWSHMFVPVGFIVFNAGDTVGRNLPGLVRSARLLLGLVALRFVFVPLFMMCNVVQASGSSLFSPAPLASDAWPLLIMAIFSLSNGWLTSCALMHAPEAVPPSERGRASSLMICSLNCGLFVGSALSFVVKSAMCGGCNPFVDGAAGNHSAP